jgi:hypothetical protein
MNWSGKDVLVTAAPLRAIDFPNNPALRWRLRGRSPPTAGRRKSVGNAPPDISSNSNDLPCL